MQQVALEQIKAELAKLVAQDGDGVTHSVEYESLSAAIEAEAKRIHPLINEFTVLDQETIDQQESNYPDMLYGAKVGDTVWGDNECWISESVIDDWTHEANDTLTDEYTNDVSDFARFVQLNTVLGILSQANSKEGGTDGA